MGMLADSFVARDDEAKSFDSTSWPKDDLFESGGLTDLELSTLWTILDGRVWEAEILDEFTHLEEDQGDEWLVRLPDAFVAKLADATPAEMDVARKAWAATEEIACDPGQLVPVTSNLQRLA